MADPIILIAIARQLGAGGAELGQRLASRLGFAYLDKEILQLAAQRAGASEQSLQQWDERVSGFWDRMVESFAVGPAEGIFTAAPRSPEVRDERLFELESRVVTKLVQRRSAVIIGRGGFWVLRQHPGLIRVFLHAPLAARIPEVMRAHQLKTESEAREMIDRVDKERERFVRTMTGCSLTDARNHDLSINTHKVLLDTAEQIILRQVEDLRARLSAAAEAVKA